jgi:hypothetical protein
MKSWMFSALVPLVFACSKRNVILPDALLSVHPVFRDSTARHRQGYNLANGEHIPYDKQDMFLKQYLTGHLDSLGFIPADSSLGRIVRIVQSSKPFKPVPLPIKVLQFSEFGYVKTKGGKVIAYAMHTNCFHDFTNNRTYVPKDTLR